MRLLFSSRSGWWGNVLSCNLTPPFLPRPSSSSINASWVMGSCLQMVIPIDVVLTRILRVVLLVKVSVGLSVVGLGLSGVVVFLVGPVVVEGEEGTGADPSSDSLEITRHSFRRLGNFFLRPAPLLTRSQ